THLKQQRGLANAARTVNEQHSPRRAAGLRIVEGPQLGSPADEALPPRAVDDVTQAGPRHHLSVHPGRTSANTSPPRPPLSVRLMFRSVTAYSWPNDTRFGPAPSAAPISGRDRRGA